MLVEFERTRQVPGEGPRRWFSSPDMDLIVWYNTKGEIDGFQLCYDKLTVEHAYTWHNKGPVTHDTVDSGELPMTRNRTPILVADGVFPVNRVTKLFQEASQNLDPELRQFVLTRLGT